MALLETAFPPKAPPILLQYTPPDETQAPKLQQGAVSRWDADQRHEL